MKRKQCRCFWVSFCLSVGVLGAAAGLFWADYNTRMATEGADMVLVSSVYQNGTLTIQTGEKVNRILISEQTQTIARYLHKALPAPLQIFELCAHEISKMFA